MKQKNGLYQPGSTDCATTPLSTWALFRRDASGNLVYAPRAESWRQPHPRGEERRTARRFEWRHDAMVCTVTAQGRVPAGSGRTCEFSSGGCSVLLDQPFEPGTLLDLQLAEPSAAHGELPLLEVVGGTRKGDVWLVRCLWLHNLRKIAACWLVRKGQAKQPALSIQPEQSWLMHMWQRFRRVCGAGLPRP